MSWYYEKCLKIANLIQSVFELKIVHLNWKTNIKHFFVLINMYLEYIASNFKLVLRLCNDLQFLKKGLHFNNAF